MHMISGPSGLIWLVDNTSEETRELYALLFAEISGTTETYLSLKEDLNPQGVWTNKQ